MTINPPPIGTAVKFLDIEPGFRPAVHDAMVVTGIVESPANLACLCIVRVGRQYHRVHDAACINPSEQVVKAAWGQWATTVLATASVDRLKVTDELAEEAEAVLLGDV